MMELRHVRQLLVLLQLLCILSPMSGRRDSCYVDMSYLMTENTLHWITDRSFEMKVTHNGFKRVPNSQGVPGDDKYWYKSEEVSYNSHTGTHMDAPCHFYNTSWCLHEIPIERLVDRPLYLFDARKYGYNKTFDYEISVQRFREFEDNQEIQNGSVLFIATGLSSKWPIKDAYFGIDHRDESLHFPGISSDLADHLARGGKYFGIGIEGPSIDPGSSVNFHAHQILAKNDIYVIENLMRPDAGSGEDDEASPRVTILPLNVEGASGSPARVIVNIGNKGCILTSGAESGHRLPTLTLLAFGSLFALLLALMSILSRRV